MAYGDTAQDGAVAVYDDVVAEDGMAVDTLDGVALRIEGEALGTKGDALVELHVIAEDTRCSDDDTRAVVDGEVATDGGGGVYVDTRLAMGHLGDDTGDEGYAQQVQLVGHAVAHDGAYGGVAADDLAVAGGGRVALVGGHHIGGKHAAQVGQATDKLDGYTLGFAMGTPALLGKAETCLYLLHKFVIEALDVDSRVVGEGVAADAGVAEIAREEDCTAECHNLAQHTKRRQGMPVGMMIEERIGRLGGREFAHYSGKVFVDIHCRSINAICRSNVRGLLMLKRYPMFGIEALCILAQLELHGVAARGIGADEAQGGIDLHLVALLHLERGKIEVGRDVLPVAYHHDVGTLYLRMLEDE